MAIKLPMPGMLHERGWTQADLNLTLRALMHLEQIAWPQADIFDAYGELGRLIEEGFISVLETVRDTVLWETLPARRAVVIGTPPEPITR